MEISTWAEQLTEDMMRIIDGEIDVKAIQTANFSPVKTRNQRRRGSFIEEEPLKEDRHISFTEEKLEAPRSLFGNLRSTMENEHKEDKVDERSERLRSRQKTRELESLGENNTIINKDIEKPSIGRISRSRTKQEGPQPIESKNEGQEGYKTRLRDRGVLNINNENTNARTNTPKILSREERLMKRLKNKGETSEDQNINDVEIRIDIDSSHHSQESRESHSVDDHSGEKPEKIKQRYPTRSKDIHPQTQKEELEEDSDFKEAQEKAMGRYERRARRSQLNEEKSNENKKEERPVRASRLQSKLLRKTETMQQRQKASLRSREESSDGSLSVGEPRKNNEKGYRSKLRRTKKTYTQYFNEGSDSDLDSDENGLADFEMPGGSLEENSENNEERSQEKETDQEGNELDGIKERIDKVRVIAERNDEAINGEQVQVKRYSTRSKDKVPS